jgi:hypothetical protein
VDEEIWVAGQYSEMGQVYAAYTTREAALKGTESGTEEEIAPIILHRPDLRPIYGGPTLMEALWNEMDRLMEGLMTGADAEDGGDKHRAQELAWVLAVVTNPYDPSVDRIRAEAMDRWNALQDQEVDPAAGSLGGIAQ